MAIRTPSSRSACKVRSVASVSCKSAVSVISNSAGSLPRARRNKHSLRPGTDRLPLKPFGHDELHVTNILGAAYWPLFLQSIGPKAYRVRAVFNGCDYRPCCLYEMHACTDTRRLTTGIRSEKCVVRRFGRCTNVRECTYTNLGSMACYTPRLYGIAYCT